MKKLAFLSAIALGSLAYNNVNAQVFQIGVQLGGGRPPVVQASVAAPVRMAPVAVDYVDADYYYYMPEVDAYYSVYEKCYYYNSGSRWVSAAYLPGAYRNYDWRAARYYEVRARRPYLNANVYRDRYHGRVYSNWDRRDNRFDNRDNRFDNRNDRRDDRFDNRNDRRDDRFDARVDRRDDRFDNKNDRRDDRFDNKNDRKEDRFDNKNYRKDNDLRFERRNDHGDDRRDDRGGRGNDRGGNGRGVFGNTRFAANK
jgi:hypothetical protein